ncbi:MAG: FAD binding domain-containing protein [Pyrinomonadaceae bacterium]
MTMASFTLHRPQTLSEALEVLRAHAGQVRIVAGGSDMVINMRMRIETPAHVLDLRGIDELRGIRFDEQDGLRVGALTTVAALANDATVREMFPVVASAAGQVAGPNIRNMGTIGGNLCLDTRCVYYNQSYFWRKANDFCLKKDGTICHVAPGSAKCWAVYSGDIAPALLTLGASVKLLSPRGERIVSLDKFFVDDGIKKYDLAADEILCEVRLPASSAGYRGVYNKFRIRESIDYPLAAAAVAVKTDDAGLCTDAQIAITALNPSPRLVEGVRELFVGKPLTKEALEQAADLTRRTAKPLRTSASTTTYRRHIIGVLARRGLAATLAPPDEAQQ